MTEGFSPVTFMVTVNQYGRMVPGKGTYRLVKLDLNLSQVACLLSENVRTVTLEVFLREVKTAIEKRAEVLVDLIPQWNNGDS